MNSKLLQSLVSVGIMSGSIYLALEINAREAFGFAPLYSTVNNYETTILNSGDLADIYFPDLSNETNPDSLPMALLLQGSYVDKANYSQYASTVASYGFVVVVPNNVNDVLTPFGFPEGFFSEQEQIIETLDYLEDENLNTSSSLFDIVDTDNLALLGHSYGGIVGLNAIEGTCSFPYCTSDFERPDALKAGVFYGSDYNQLGIFPETPPINNGDVPIALLSGTLDGLASPDRIATTYEQIQQPPKTLVNVLGANHYGITNTNNPFATVPDFNFPTLEQEIAIETIARWSSVFLRANLLDDEDAIAYLYNTGDLLDTNVTVTNQRSVPEPSTILGLLGFGLTAFRFKEKLKK
ncbi:PEP-CTERM sorting domain-containing protein [Roseofilum casamattae]|uniref:PEP-CTERM sorting domain-containing protein n=1 Tax=Roseofilum casamattae BLCC-M143 TaxID=3022442 RepID=A0ABT7BYE8_9CYAN|nr:PEP-CTERM sorting domain-containing protein [Roseofilum casamattae]MDJ1184232.1 PEP-CTERM sorting domain-containing protein [Roseofilum casamattae BLCC-M143]